MLFPFHAAVLTFLLCLGPATGLEVAVAETATPSQMAEAPVINPSEEPAADPADEPDANLVPVETELPADSQSASDPHPDSRVPRAEDLLTVTPPQQSSTSRFSDSFDAPAETAQTAPSGPSQKPVRSTMCRS